MRFLLDTNVVSELRKVPTKQASPAVVSFFRALDPAELYLSCITVLELEFGVLLADRRNPALARRLRQWLHTDVLPTFAGRILPVDIPVALRCAQLHVPATRPERDALIAATALVHGMTVVTRNRGDFEPAGVPILNPWEPSQGL